MDVEYGCRCAMYRQSYQTITTTMKARIAIAISNIAPTKFLPAAQSLQRRSENPPPGRNIENTASHHGECVTIGRLPHCWQIRVISAAIRRLAASLRNRSGWRNHMGHAAPCGAKSTFALAPKKKGGSRLLAIRLGSAENYGVESNPSMKISSVRTAHPCTFRSSMTKPSGVRPTDESLLMRKRNFTVWPA